MPCAVLAAGLGALCLAYRPSIPETEASIAPAETTLDEAPAPAAPPSAAAPLPPPTPIEPSVVDGIVRSGDTIWGLLGDYLTPQQIHKLSQDSRKVFPLSRICAGQPYRLCTVEGDLESFVYEIDREETLVIRAVDGDFHISRVPIPYDVQTDLIRGTIRTSLFETVAEIGESPELALALADIFAWDIDFILDIREGDSFQAVIERRFREDQPAGYGSILAAEFINQGQTYRAILFQDGDRPPSYYDPNGNSVRKAFLKAPLAFSRISSGFSRRRFHPIAKTWRAHPAIDYAAPKGTPIKSVGDGTVIKKGYTKGNGNYVKIRHNSSYETLYLHMSRFARGMKRGKRVTQGQVIGYVGSTGLATGPHLCFRMHKDGKPVNPLRVKSVPAEPVSRKRRAEFEVLASGIAARLDGSGLEQAKLPE